MFSTLDVSLFRVFTFFDIVKEVFNASEEVALAFLYAVRTLPSTPYVIKGTGSRGNATQQRCARSGLPARQLQLMWSALLVRIRHGRAPRANTFGLESMRLPTSSTAMCLYIYAFGTLNTSLSSNRISPTPGPALSSVSLVG